MSRGCRTSGARGVSSQREHPAPGPLWPGYRRLGDLQPESAHPPLSRPGAEFISAAESSALSRGRTCDPRCSGYGHERRAGEVAGEDPNGPRPRRIYSMSPSLTGGCNCGAVRFEITEPLFRARYCHCTRCQRRTGTAASANATVVPGSFRIVSGEAALKAWKPPDGHEKWFCGECGSRFSPATPPTTPRRGCDWGPSMATPGCDPNSDSSSPTPRPGRRSRTTGCLATRSAHPPEWAGTPGGRLRRLLEAVFQQFFFGFFPRFFGHFLRSSFFGLLSRNVLLRLFQRRSFFFGLLLCRRFFFRFFCRRFFRPSS